MENKTELLENLLKKYKSIVLNFKHLHDSKKQESLKELSKTDKFIIKLIKE